MSAYTLSLALSITFKQYREAKLPSAQLLAKENLETFYRCLEKMSDTWWLAAIMLRLGKRAVDKIQRSTNTEQPSHLTLDTGHSTGEDRDPHQSVNRTSINIHGPQPIESDDRDYFNEANKSVNTSHMDFLPDFSPDFNSLLDTSMAPSNNAETFDAFFTSFPDVNFPSSSVEQFLWEIGT